jgi:hypothetical protein
MNEVQLSVLISLLFLIQNKFIEQLGSLYGMLMTTFDPEEVPLISFYLRNPQHFADFADIERLIKNTLLLASDNILSGVNMIDIICMFNYYYEQYFSLVVEIDERPITFKTFKTWLEKFKQGNDDMKNYPTKPMQIFFSRSNKHIQSFVANALKQSHSDDIM